MAHNCFAQERQEISTDRPDQTESATIVPQGSLQFESGFILEHDKANSTHSTHFTYNTTLLRYGITKRVEMRFINEFTGDRIRTENMISKTQGLSPASFGIKIKLLSGKNHIPEVALISHLQMENNRPDHAVIDCKLAGAHTLTNKMSLSYNAGFKKLVFDKVTKILYTLSLSYSVTNDFGFFAEAYGFFAKDSHADNRCDAGLTYKLAHRIQYDLSGGIGLNEGSPDYFLSTGISFRLLK